MRNKPDEIREAFEIGESKLFRSLGEEFDSKKNSYEQALSAELEARIARMAERLLQEKTGTTTKLVADKPQGFKMPLPAMGCLFGTIAGLGAGFLIWGGTPGELNSKDSQVLNWAKSKQGEFARQLVEWNGDRLLNRTCEAEAQAGNITLAIERVQATRGVCAIFVRDPRETHPQQVSGGEL